jgi:peroxiredoxin
MNRHLSLLLLLCSAWLTAASQASPAAAALVEKEYQASMEKWSLEIRVAATPEARDAAIQKRPNPYNFAKRMWAEIEDSLDQDWTLEPAAWFLRLSAGLMMQKPDGTPAPAFAEQAEKIRAAVAAHHLSSNKLSPICLALPIGSDPRSLPLLEKIESTNPDQKVQGTASLGIAMILKTLGDSPDIMKKRLTHLRNAIIKSADVEVDGVSVSKLAEDELYIIRYLTKGRVAPDLQGFDSAKRPLSLADQKGKVVVLLFWNSSLPDTARLLQLSASMEEKFKGKPFVLIGVNNDPVEKLRAMQADGSVKWPNFSDPENKLSTEYRVGSWPLAYVLDGERKVHYAGAPGSFVELTADALLQQAATGAAPTAK